jgi:hypothetical protein
MRGISWLAEDVLASQKGLCSVVKNGVKPWDFFLWPHYSRRFSTFLAKTREHASPVSVTNSSHSFSLALGTYCEVYVAVSPDAHWLPKVHSCLMTTQFTGVSRKLLQEWKHTKEGEGTLLLLLRCSCEVQPCRQTFIATKDSTIYTFLYLGLTEAMPRTPASVALRSEA